MLTILWIWSSDILFDNAPPCTTECRPNVVNWAFEKTPWLFFSLYKLLIRVDMSSSDVLFLQDEQLITLCCLRLIDLFVIFEHDMLWFKQMSKREAEIWYGNCLCVSWPCEERDQRKASLRPYSAGTRKYWLQGVEWRMVEHFEKRLNLKSQRRC